jgi:teichuronic acid biosynthesis glycosyltransferase TuaG
MIRISGTAKTRNEGLKRATGEYIAFLDSDDYWDPNFLEEQLKFIQENGCAVVTAGYRRKTSKTCTDYIPPAKITADSILGGNPISCLSTLFKRDENNQILFDESLVKAEDLLFWYETLKKNGPAAGNRLVLATYRIVESSKSQKEVQTY